MKKLYMLGMAALLSVGLAACSSGGETQQQMDPNAEQQGVGGVDPAQPSEGMEDPSVPTTDGMEDPSVPTTGDGAEEGTESPDMNTEESETDQPSTTDPASPSDEETTTEIAPAPENTQGQ